MITTMTQCADMMRGFSSAIFFSLGMQVFAWGCICWSVWNIRKRYQDLTDEWIELRNAQHAAFVEIAQALILKSGSTPSDEVKH